MVLAKGNLPRTQSHDELITSFKITVPIPLIARNELRLTTHPVGVYLHLLKLLADNHSSFLQDHKAFTNVVAHYFVFLRRFWKHLIKVRHWFHLCLDGTYNPSPANKAPD